jgi:hypothetical protein
MSRTIEFQVITRALNVTPSDTDYLPATKAIFVSVSGDLAVEMLDGTEVTFTGISASVFHPISVSRVLSTGTTATGIIAGY